MKCILSLLLIVLSFGRLKAQTLRQLILYSDAIVLGEDSIINIKCKIDNSYSKTTNYQNGYFFSENIFVKNRKIIPPKLLKSEVLTIPFMANKPNCLDMIGYNEPSENIYFLKKIKGKWTVLTQKKLPISYISQIELAINSINEIEKIQNINAQFDAYVDWILNTNSNGLGFDYSKTELIKSSTFMDYYHQKGLSGILSNENKEQLFTYIENEIFNEYDYNSYFDKDLLYLVYADYRERLLAAFLKRVKYEYEHLENEDNITNDDIRKSSIFDLENTIETLYEYDKSFIIINKIVEDKSKGYYSITTAEYINYVQQFLQQEGLIEE